MATDVLRLSYCRCRCLALSLSFASLLLHVFPPPVLISYSYSPAAFEKALRTDLLTSLTVQTLTGKKERRKFEIYSKITIMVMLATVAKLHHTDSLVTSEAVVS